MMHCPPVTICNLHHQNCSFICYILGLGLIICEWFITLCRKYAVTYAINSPLCWIEFVPAETPPTCLLN